VIVMPLWMREFFLKREEKLVTVKKRNRHRPLAMGMDIAMFTCAIESVEYERKSTKISKK